MGNLIPLLISAPLAILGIWKMLSTGDFLGQGLTLFCAFPVVAWLSVNYFGLFKNRTMRREMLKRLRAARTDIPMQKFFVGVATPSHRGVWDPHEDVGYLMMFDAKLEFFGEKISTVIEKHCITSITFRPNPHSVVGLGRWISIEGMFDHAPIRLNVELREKDTLLGNRILSSSLKKRLEVWLKSDTKNAPS